MKSPLALTLLAVLIASGIPAVMAQSQTPASSAEAPKAAWPVTCRSRDGSSELSCSMSQVIATKDSGQRVIAASVQRNKDGKALLRLSLPHGLLLPKGVAVWADEEPRATYPIVTADKNGSYAVIDLDKGLAQALKKGRQLNIAVQRFTGGEVVFQLPLEGFSAGFAKL